MATRKPQRKTRRAVTPRKTRRVARPWTREEIAFMRKYYRKYETTWCARQLGRTVYSVRYKAVDLNIQKASPSVWRGNRGPANAFRKPVTRQTTTNRKVAKRQQQNKRTYRASNVRRTNRRSNRRQQ
ncbi:MAG TPA: hypothetical protein PLF13_01205 [candidate division Zixibacteria bacterium]|nr:hypothetical protein [candidate division Zixibacteria bacterium]